MGRAEKPASELPSTSRPRCPKCKMRMVTASVSPGPEGFERRIFDCRKCGHSEANMIACDPLRSDAVGWISGELGRLQHKHAPD